MKKIVFIKLISRIYICFRVIHCVYNMKRKFDDEFEIKFWLLLHTEYRILGLNVLRRKLSGNASPMG